MATKANLAKLEEGLQNPPVTTTSSGSKNPMEALLNMETTRRRFTEVLGKKAAGFMSSILSAFNTNSALAECEPGSVLSSGMIAATLDLPINGNLGFAYIVPYKGKATFQMGWKGFVQLAMRSGQYETLNVTEVYEGQLEDYNPFTGEMKFKNAKVSEKVIGFVAYERLLNGFWKYVYMTTEDAEKHAKRFSQSYRGGFGVWKDDFNAMAKKTVIKALLSKWGVLSIEMQRAITYDQAVVTAEDRPEYIDNAKDVVLVEFEAGNADGLAGEEGPNKDK